MAENSKIEWCDDTRNLWWGCYPVHEGCDNCYAMRLANRYKDQWGGDPLWNKTSPRRAVKGVWADFERSERLAIKEGRIRRVFVGSMMDIFEKPQPLIDHEGNPLNKTTGDLRNRFFEEVVPNSPSLVFLLLTKRPSNILKYIPEAWKENPPANVMFGASVVDQKSLENVWYHMNNVSLAGFSTFWSIEPLLEEINLVSAWSNVSMRSKGGVAIHPDWVIVGGESGPGKRPFNADWARSCRDFFHNEGTPFFMKQVDKVQPIPGDLMIREFPKMKLA